jgi:hypothetical protein
MPRTLRPLILAAIVGSALTLAVVGLMSMTQVLPAGQHVIVSYGPEPRDMVQIKQGTPYVVPAGKIFVLTGLGDAEALDYARLVVNGQIEAIISTGCSNGGGSSLVAVPPGFTVQAGSTISAEATGTINGRAWGYLANP